MNTEVNNILHILIRDEKTWLSMAEEISNNSKISAKDLLHDFYIALHSKIDSGKVKINNMIRAGLLLNIISVFVVTAISLIILNLYLKDQIQIFQYSPYSRLLIYFL